MLGRTISHYRIVSQLGAGGMGVVYAAEDIRLGRPVALKFVPQDLAADRQAVERFRVEARAASALNHPNICTIYDIGEDEGRPFIVMELMKGQTLRERLVSGPLKIHQIVDTGIQVADALEAAHAQGIVHRDIKPANLFLLDRGQAKIMDFGLAKLTSGQDGGTTGPVADQLTAPGVTLGTVSYMSPEQAASEDLDGRTDLFSLGVVLYECATGHRPFNGNSAGVILAAILNKSPVAPVVFNPDLPLRLQEVINNCLEKDRDLRYQTAADLRADLRRVKRDLESGRLSPADAMGERPSGSSSRSAPAALGIDAHGSGDVTSLTGTGGATVARAFSNRPIEAPREGPHSSGTMPAPAATAPRPAARHWLIALAASLVLLGGAAAIYFLSSGGQSTSPRGASEQRAADGGLQAQVDEAKRQLGAKNYRGALVSAEQALAAAPNHPDARRVRDEARAALEPFDAAITEARRLLRAGDGSGAARALERARAIDPTGPGLAEVSGQLAEEFRGEAEAAREELQRSRAQVSTLPAGRGAAEKKPTPATPSATRQSAPVSQPGSPAQSAPPVVPPASAPSLPPAKPPEEEPPAKSRVDPSPPAPSPPAPTVSPPAPTASSRPVPQEPAARATPEPSPPAEKSPASHSAADDDAAIARVVATYARAIETKSLALFRSVKPNLSREEEQRIESGFRAVSSQQVAISIASIERRGTQAFVRLRRRDTIEGGGRQQTTQSEQAMTLTRTEAGNWVIVEIGR